MPQPFCRAEFASIGESPQPTWAKVVRSEAKHEMLVMRFRDRNLSSRNYRSGMPLRVRWGVAPRYREEFHGYVHFAEPVVQRDEPGPPQVEVVAVGATRVLRDEEPHFWGRTRADLVARDIALRHRLGVDADRGLEVHDNLMQGAESSWHFLRELAEAEGLHLSTHGTRINLWNLHARSRALRATAPVFDRRRNEVSRFKPITSESGPKHETSEDVAYAMSLAGRESGFSDRFSPTLRSLTRERTAPNSYRKVHTEVLEDAVDAERLVRVGRTKRRRAYRATAEIAAFPRLRPGDPLVFAGYGARSSGYWTLREVTFELTAEGTMASVEVERAEIGDDGQRPTAPGGRSALRRRPAAELVRGRWVDRQAP